MLFFSLLAFVPPIYALPALQHPFAEPFSPPPSPPKLEHLFTAHLEVKPNTAPVAPGPRGIRLNHAILGGTVKGELVSGMLRPYGGADWTVVDPASGVAFVDARWSFVLPAVVSSSCDDEKDQATSVDREVFVRSDGPFLPGPEQTKAHVRLSFETAGTIATQGVTWLNFVVGLGVLEILNPSNTSLYDVKVDVFIPEGEYGPTPRV